MASTTRFLDNCHVRVSFATNDERTAKRVSDALGTATEIRDAKNYAGHRLSPWLGHLMVTRQETARPLLTPGEVMQLPPDDQLVLVSGCHPIRAKKARYFEDPQLQTRILPPPVPSVLPNANSETGAPRREHGNPWAEAIVQASQPAEDPDNAGIRREPDLPKQEEVVRESRKPVREFDLADDDSPEPSQDVQALQRRNRRLARQVALDPGDGMDL
jgi:type IV secretion system protein VirD4